MLHCEPGALSRAHWLLGAYMSSCSDTCTIKMLRANDALTCLYSPGQAATLLPASSPASACYCSRASDAESLVRVVLNNTVFLAFLI
jgi:hypothetical protein